MRLILNIIYRISEAINVVSVFNHSKSLMYTLADRIANNNMQISFRLYDFTMYIMPIIV